jgi:hypothetical protein
MEIIQTLINIINNFTLAELCSAGDYYVFVKKYNKAVRINDNPILDEELYHNIVIAHWQPIWTDTLYHYKYQVLYKWLYLNSLWKTLAYLSTNQPEIEVRLLYDRDVSINKEKMLELYKYIPNNKKNMCLDILLICLPACMPFCETLLNIKQLDITELDNIIFVISGYLSRPIKNRITVHGICYTSQEKFITAMNFSCIIKTCIQQIDAIKFYKSLRYAWITAIIRDITQ